jgi:glycosyltransferase involved in cell wall biosynthesis
MNPKVSICIPAYGQPEKIERALKSVFEQTFEDFEVIITDDTPDESVFNIVKNFDDKKIKYYKNQERKGSPENWNVCLEHVRGEYIKFLHHDDWFFNKDSLSGFIKMLDNNHNVDIAFCASANYNADETIKYIYYPPAVKLNKLRKNYLFLFSGNIIGAPSATIYRSRVSQKFDRNLKWLVDIDFYLRILSENHEFVSNKDPLISIETGSEKQVTHLCQDNKCVELFEYIYMYSKYRQTMKFAQTRFLCHLLCLYGIKSKKEIKALGVDLPKNIFFDLTIFLNKYLFK